MRPNERKTILMLEREPTLRGAAKQLLEREGDVLMAAGDVAEALELFRAHRHRLIAVVFEPGDAASAEPQVLQAIREVNADVLVMVTSEAASATSAQRFVDGDRVVFLQRPFAPLTLVELIRTYRGADRTRPS